MSRFGASLFSALVVVLFSPRLYAQAPSAIVATLASESIDDRRAAAAALVALGSRGTDETTEIAQELQDLRRDPSGQVAALIAEQRGRIPKDADLLQVLVALKPDRTTRQATATLCLARALARIGTTPAVRELVSGAGDDDGAFQPELLRELRQLDERATAALVEARSDPSPVVQAWAKDVLEALGKRTPGDAVQTTNDEVLVDVIRAYALTRDADALSVVLSFVNSERAQVRSTARDAILAYGDDALGRVRAAYAALTGKHLPEEPDAAAAARALFAASDHNRLRDVYARMDEGFARLRSGDVRASVAAFDDVLARQPLIDRQADMVPAYVRYAESLEQADRPQALFYLRKALRLDDGRAKNHLRGEVAVLEGEELMARGIVDRRLFEQALEVDPPNEHARERLAGLRSDATRRRDRERIAASAVGALGLALMTLGVFGLGLRRRGPRRI